MIKTVTVPVINTRNASMATANPVRKFSMVIFLPKHSVSLPPRTNVMQAITSMAIVVVLTPPAVPPGEPPMNIRMQSSSLLSCVSPDCDTVKNPAVLVVTDWNMDAITFFPKLKSPIVSGLWYSSRNVAIVPIARRIRVVTIASFE